MRMDKRMPFCDREPRQRRGQGGEERKRENMQFSPIIPQVPDDLPVHQREYRDNNKQPQWNSKILDQGNIIAFKISQNNGLDGGELADNELVREYGRIASKAKGRFPGDHRKAALLGRMGKNRDDKTGDSGRHDPRDVLEDSRRPFRRFLHTQQAADGGRQYHR